MITTRTLGAITILDLHGPLGAGQDDAALPPSLTLYWRSSSLGSISTDSGLFCSSALWLRTVTCSRSGS
jgi:hypothetical protein